MELSLDYLSGRRASQGILIKDSTALLDGARPSPKYFNVQYNNTFGGFCLGINSKYKVHGGFIKLSTDDVSESIGREIHLL